MASNGGLPFKVGQQAELITFEEGFRGAWFRCKVHLEHMNFYSCMLSSIFLSACYQHIFVICACYISLRYIYIFSLITSNLSMNSMLLLHIHSIFSMMDWKMDSHLTSIICWLLATLRHARSTYSTQFYSLFTDLL